MRIYVSDANALTAQKCWNGNAIYRVLASCAYIQLGYIPTKFLHVIRHIWQAHHLDTHRHVVCTHISILQNKKDSAQAKEVGNYVRSHAESAPIRAPFFAAACSIRFYRPFSRCPTTRANESKDMVMECRPAVLLRKWSSYSSISL